MGLLGAELVVLLLWSYGTEGCVEADCAPLAQAAGIAARVDVPVLAALFLVASSQWAAPTLIAPAASHARR